MTDTELVNSGKLLRVKDVQVFLGIGRDTAYALMHCSSFPAVKLGGRYYVAQDELEKWLTKSAYKTVVL